MEIPLEPIVISDLPKPVSKFIDDLDLVKSQIEAKKAGNIDLPDPKALELYDKVYDLVKSVKEWKKVGDDPEVQVWESEIYNRVVGDEANKEGENPMKVKIASGSLGDSLQILE